MSDRFQRTEMLLGPEAMHRLGSARVAVFGVGGVGGYVVEALARSGVGALDLFETQFDGLARIMRKECRKRGIDSLKVVYSEEEPMTPLAPPLEDTDGTSPEGLPKRRKDTPGSISFVPSVAGLILAGEVVKDLTGVRNDKA